MPERCAGCWSPLAEPLPDEPIAQVRCECGFINLFERNVVVLPLRETLEAVADAATIEDLLADTDDPGRGREVLERSFDLFVLGAKDVIDADPLAAAASVWHNLVEFDRTSAAFRAGDRTAMYHMIPAARSVQILLGCLTELDADDVLDAGLPVPRIQRFVDRFFKLASSAATIAPMVEGIAGGLMQGVVRQGRYELRKTAAHSRFQEWILNRDRRERERKNAASDEELFSAAAAEAQELWLGFSPATGRALFDDKHQILRDLSEKREETVYAIPAGSCPPLIAGLFDRFTLSRDRALRFETPFFWDLGAVKETADPAEVVRRLGRRNWLNYYPVVRAENDEPVYLVSAEALTFALASLESFKNGLLQRISDHLKDDDGADPDLRQRVSQLRIATNRKLEELAAARGRELGFEAASGLERIDGRPLEGGEIDLLWAGSLDGRLVIVLGEAKDFDLTLHRLGSEGGFRGKLQSAEQQIERKAATVRRQWRALVPLISEGRLKADADSAVFAKLLLTSAYLPPHLPQRYPALTLDDLERFIGQVRQWPDGFPPRFAEHAVELLS